MARHRQAVGHQCNERAAGMSELGEAGPRPTRVRKKRGAEKKQQPGEGQPFSPWHNFPLYKVIRASPELPPGAKVTWEALVERIWEGQTTLYCSYDALAADI